MQKAPSIVLFSDLYPHPVGGMETHANEFNAFLKKQTYWSYKGMICFTDDKPIQKEIVKDKIVLLPKSAIRNSEEVISYLESINFGEGDIAFFNSLWWIEILSDLKKRFPESIFIQRSGGNDIVQSAIYTQGDTLRERHFFVSNTINNCIDVLIVPSSYSKKKLSEIGVTEHKMKVIVGGVDTKRFVPCDKRKEALRAELNVPKDKYIILEVARLVPFKGIEVTLHGLSLLAESTKEFIQYVLVGAGPEEVKIKKLVNELQLEKNVSMVGLIPQSQTQAYYQAADLFCHTPRFFKTAVMGGEYIHTETMGRSLCEASATQLPVIVANVGGVSEVIKNTKSGVIISPENPKAVADTITYFLKNQEHGKQMGVCGRKIAEKELSWDTVFSTYVSLFQQIQK